MSKDNIYFCNIKAYIYTCEIINHGELILNNSIEIYDNINYHISCIFVFSTRFT